MEPVNAKSVNMLRIDWWNGRQVTIEVVRAYCKMREDRFAERSQDVTFSYSDIRRFYYDAIGRPRNSPDFNSIQRHLRGLAEEGLLLRSYPMPNKVFFHVTPWLVGQHE